MGRKLTPEEIEAEGLPTPKRKLTPEEIAAEGLPVPETPAPVASPVDAMGLGSAAGHRFLSSALSGFSDEAAGAMTPGLFRLRAGGDESAQLRNPRTGEAASSGQFKKLYRAGRDIEREKLKKAEAELGALKYPVDIAGAIAGYLSGGKLVGSGLKAALALGGAAGLGASEADLTKGEVGRMAVDTATGAGVSGGLYGIGKLGGLAAEKSGLAPWLREKGISVARRFLHGGVNPLSVKEPVSREAAEESLKTGVTRAFSTISGAAPRSTALAQQREKIYGEILDDLAKEGFEGPDATALALRLLQEGEDIAVNSLQSPAPGMFRDVAEELASKPTLGTGGRLGLGQAENMKRTLQKAARAEYGKPGHTLEGEAKMDIASRVRAANEEAVAQQAALPGATQKAREAAAAFVPQKEALGKAYEIEAAALKAASQAAKRNAIGLDTTIVGAASVPAAIASGNLEMLAIPVAHALAKSRGGSTLASALYGTGSALRDDMGPMSAAAGRGVLDYILEANDPEAAKRRALIDYLRGGE